MEQYPTIYILDLNKENIIKIIIKEKVLKQNNVKI